MLPESGGAETTMRYDQLFLCAALPLASLSGCIEDTQRRATTDVFVATYGSTGDAPRKLFISGHSLTNRPLPDFLAAIAADRGIPLEWNMQHLEGSSLRMRTQGSGTPALAGYRDGVDRNRQRVDVLREIAPVDGVPPYDTLMLTEVHTLLESLLWNDTIGHASDYVERFSQHNPNGQTYLYASWLNVDDLDKPDRWIAYENAANRAWQCTAIELNRRLDAKNVTRPVRLIPAAQALAALVDQSLSVQGLAGISQDTPKASMELLFADDVHLTETGNYYIALVTHMALYGSLPETPWNGEVAPETARALSEFAQQFMTRWLRQQKHVQINCSDYFADEFSNIYLSYVRDTKWRADEGWLRAYYKWVRYSIEWPRLFRTNTPANPFRHNRASVG